MFAHCLQDYFNGVWVVRGGHVHNVMKGKFLILRSYVCTPGTYVYIKN